MVCKPVVGIALGERMVRVEEELQYQHELMQAGFVRIGQQLAQQGEDMNRRLEGVDKRFDEMLTHISFGWSFHRDPQWIGVRGLAFFSTACR